MDIIYFIMECIGVTIATIITLSLVFTLAVYIISVTKLVAWSLSTGIFKNPFMWFNPMKLLKYSGSVTTFSAEEGSYIINYEGIVPKTKFIKK